MLRRKLLRYSRLTTKAAILFITAIGSVDARASQPAATAAKPPTASEIRSACDYVAARGPSIRSELLRDATIDARNNGELVDATIGAEGGSAGGEILQLRPRGTSKHAVLDISYFDDRPWENRGFGARWFVYRGHTYALIFESESLRRAKHLSLIDGQNREHLLCTFSTQVHETLIPADNAAGPLCRAVASERVTYLPVRTDSTTPSLQYVDGPRAETGVSGVTIADFTNSGTPDKVVRLEYEHSGARGGAATYYDVAGDGKYISQRAKHELLMNLQHVEEQPSRFGDAIYPSFADDNVTRLFSYDGLTYFDIAATGGNAYDDSPFHEVRLLKGDRIATMCAARFRFSWKVSAIAREYRK
jgi:hypothetical protein